MNVDSLIYGVLLITFTFGAVLLSALTLTYGWERRQRQRDRGGAVLPAFTLVCAIAFVVNLGLQFSPPDALGDWLLLVRTAATGLLAPLALHLVVGATWRRVITAMYLFAAPLSLLRGLNASGLLNGLAPETPPLAPAMVLGACSVLGLGWIVLQREQSNERRWDFALLAMMLVCSIAAPLGWGAVAAVPDYLLLALLAVTLYYRERLMFFDLLVKRGVYFAVGLLALSAVFAWAGWTPWTAALLLSPLWLTGPSVYSLIERMIDRYWLQRRLSPADAEREFIGKLQSAGNEADLERLAVESLSAIFQAPVTIEVRRLESTDELRHDGGRIGCIGVGPRRNGLPYLSDDHRLLESLANTLSVVMENIRFRERARELQSLASRAELKALRAQINPHFLFNALNAIAGLIQEQPHLADETVEQLAHVFRYTLRKSANEWVPLAEEVDFVTAYLRVEQARFGARLRVEFDLDPRAAAVEIPSMSVQPLIENAIRHGVANVREIGTVGLKASVDEGDLTIEVFDNGPGFPEAFALGESEDSHGLRNVAQRLAGYYGQSAELHWVRENGVTRVRMRLPVAVEAGRDTRTNR